MPNPELSVDRWLLGHALTSEAIQYLVQDWPNFAMLDEEDFEKAVLNRRLSLINQDLGIYLFFTTYAAYYDRYGEPKSQGELILARVVLTLNFHESYKAFQGVLPLKIQAEHKFADIEQINGRAAKPWKTLDGFASKARWLQDGLDIDVSFNSSDGAIKLISLMPEPVQAYRLPKPTPAQLPPPHQLQQLFGSPLKTLAQQSVMSLFGIADREAEIIHYGEADYTDQFAVELYFKPGNTFDSELHPLAPDSEELCFSGIRYRCDLDFGSNGYQGPLPWNLEMDDTADVVTSKAGAKPIKQHLDIEDGAARWRTQACDIHVLFSYLEDRIYRVTLLAHGCYED
jgi:hypothetical protein